MKMFCPEFKHGEPIPSRYTCDGEDISVSIGWLDIPENTKSLALIMDDPEAHNGTWVHWLVYNMPPTRKALPSACPNDATLDDGSLQGLNSWGRTGYGGPCPPTGNHHYFFKLYALDCRLDGKDRLTKEALLNEMQGHIIDQTEIVGTYHRR